MRWLDTGRQRSDRGVRHGRLPRARPGDRVDLGSGGDAGAGERACSSRARTAVGSAGTLSAGSRLLAARRRRLVERPGDSRRPRRPLPGDRCGTAVIGDISSSMVTFAALAQHWPLCVSRLIGSASPRRALVAGPWTSIGAGRDRSHPRQPRGARAVFHGFSSAAGDSSALVAHRQACGIRRRVEGGSRVPVHRWRPVAAAAGPRGLERGGARNSPVRISTGSRTALEGCWRFGVRWRAVCGGSRRKRPW